MKNVHLHYEGNLKKVRLAVDRANEILATEQFYDQIRAYRKFDNSTLSPEIIARLMQESGHKINVSVNWIVPVVKTKHNKIILSGWEFSTDLATAVNNLIYETVNSIDCLYELMNAEKEQRSFGTFTAPWVIGSIAEVMFREEEKMRFHMQYEAEQRPVHTFKA